MSMASAIVGSTCISSSALLLSARCIASAINGNSLGTYEMTIVIPCVVTAGFGDCCFGDWLGRHNKQ